MKGSPKEPKNSLEEARQAVNCLTETIELIQIQTHEIHLLKVRMDILSIELRDYVQCIQLYASGKEDKGEVAKAVLTLYGKSIS